MPTEVVRRDPNRTLVPGARVSAVVEAPWGAHPTAVAGYYDFDYPYFAATGAAYRTVEGWHEYAADWIYGVEDRGGYMALYRERFGEAWLENARASAPVTPVPGAEVDYGYAEGLQWPGRPE